nr:thiol reductant ABC exporter subunit CydD [Kibdelosporangium sp. MJ126-NF4]CEL19948.1 Transport ATP-binding protein CydD [Kibdelosporangium sp. MJ126-NF4]CTQ97172.1 Transport ATP-binding protein CydD [Kibdelosporangium sp. MJ126-NF4]
MGTRGPIDPQVLARLPRLRRYLAVRSVLAVAGAALVIGQSIGVASVLAVFFVDSPAAALSSAWVVPLLAVIVGRIVLAAVERWWNEHVLAALKADLRDQVAHSLLGRGFAHVHTVDGGTGAAKAGTLLTRGVDALDAYVVGGMGLMPAAAIVPTAVVATLFAVDWPSAIVVVIVLPIVPLLLALVGLHTKERSARQWSAMLRLGGQFLEAVSGLVTLRVLGRDRRTAARVREVAEDHRKASMSALRLAFLSSLVLETLTTLSVALIAVPVGFRLLDGAIGLSTGLAVLLLTPEAFRPLRMVGTQFHASEDGKVALRELTSLLDAPEQDPRPAVVTERSVLADVREHPIVLDDLAVGWPGAQQPVLSGVSLEFEPGGRYAVVGLSGAGKSTLLRTVAGLMSPVGGRVLVDGVDVSTVDPRQWRQVLGVVPQRPHLFGGTVLDNISIGWPQASAAQVWDALERAGAANVVSGLPEGLDTVLGENGVTLSAGERQRLAVARALVRDPAVLLLDEPTARLDGETEEGVLAAMDALAGTVIIVTHRPRVVEYADHVIVVEQGGARLAAVTA